MVWQVLLEAHTEMAFHPNTPTFVVLVCLRQDPERKVINPSLFAQFFSLVPGYRPRRSSCGLSACSSCAQRRCCALTTPTLTLTLTPAPREDMKRVLFESRFVTGVDTSFLNGKARGDTVPTKPMPVFTHSPEGAVNVKYDQA